MVFGIVIWAGNGVCVVGRDGVFVRGMGHCVGNGVLVCCLSVGCCLGCCWVCALRIACCIACGLVVFVSRLVFVSCVCYSVCTFGRELLVTRLACQYIVVMVGDLSLGWC